jgi:hypothetical protein
VIELLAVTIVETESGGFTETKVNRLVYADKRSVRQSEFYQAAQAGLKPEIVFVVRRIDYADERLLSDNGLEYSIIRTYEAKNEMIELVSTRSVNREAAF